MLTGSSLIRCHWCHTSLGNAGSVVYLNGNRPCCDLCLSKTESPLVLEHARYKVALERIAGAATHKYASEETMMLNLIATAVEALHWPKGVARS